MTFLTIFTFLIIIFSLNYFKASFLVFRVVHVDSNDCSTLWCSCTIVVRERRFQRFVFIYFLDYLENRKKKCMVKIKIPLNFVNLSYWSCLYLTRRVSLPGLCDDVCVCVHWVVGREYRLTNISNLHSSPKYCGVVSETLARLQVHQLLLGLKYFSFPWKQVEWKYQLQ